MRAKIVCFLIIAMILSFGSCGRRGPMVSLSDIESYINERPDSALAAIRQINTIDLRGRKAKAKYALLHAMALDKNYIDTADTRIVQPAVGCYDRHGSPDERLKAYYYLGRELYNGMDYYGAFLAYSNALESLSAEDCSKQAGMLYTGLADVCFKTYDYDLCEEYLNKAQKVFDKGGYHDFFNMVRIRLAQVYANSKRYDKAEACFTDMLAEDSMSPALRLLLKGDFAVFLCYYKRSAESSALNLFSEILEEKGVLSDENQYGAYAYALLSEGYKEKSDSALMMAMAGDGGLNNRYYKYWLHRILKLEGNYRKAYNMLFEANQASDSLVQAAVSYSSSKARMAYLDTKRLEELVYNQRLKYISLAVVLFLALISSLVYLVYLKAKNKHAEERNRLIILMDSLRSQIRELEAKMDEQREKLSSLSIHNSQAKFTYLSKLYEILHLAKNNNDDISLDRLYKIIKGRVRSLEDNMDTSAEFENSLNKETGGIMIKFREDFPDMKEQEYRLVSYIFAGFDNATLSLLFNLSQSHTRTRKTRLLAKIKKGVGERIKEYERYF